MIEEDNCLFKKKYHCFHGTTLLWGFYLFLARKWVLFVLEESTFLGWQLSLSQSLFQYRFKSLLKPISAHIILFTIFKASLVFLSQRRWAFSVNLNLQRRTLISYRSTLTHWLQSSLGIGIKYVIEMTIIFIKQII